MIAVSQIRRRAILAVEATAQRYIRARKIAPIVKYAATSNGTGSTPVAFGEADVAADTWATAHIQYPVTTGYSI